MAAAATWLALCAPAPAQDYPTRSIKLIIPLGPGGGGDVFARALADELHKAWGQPVVVENRPGGGQNIGARACAELPPDGYTICIMSSEPLVYNQFFFKSIPYDPEKDFEPVVNLFINTLALVVNRSLGVRTIPDLVALAKAKPGTLSYGTFAFPLAHFMEKLKKETGADIVRVPFRSGGELATAVLSGSTPVAIRAVQHGPAAAERPHRGDCGQQQAALAAVSGHPDAGRGPQRRGISHDVVWPVHAGGNAQGHPHEARE